MTFRGADALLGGFHQQAFQPWSSVAAGMEAEASKHWRVMKGAETNVSAPLLWSRGLLSPLPCTARRFTWIRPDPAGSDEQPMQRTL